jgi:hypothetical protein
MLELIDQTNPAALRYRCRDCHVEGVSNPVYQPDHMFLVPSKTQEGGVWVHHECNPEDVERVAEYNAAVLAAQREAAEAEKPRRRKATESTDDAS